MLLTHHSHQDIQIITLDGSLTHHDAPQVRQQLAQLIEETSPFVILDLGKIQFADARGLSTFITAAKLAKTHQGEVVLLNITPALRTIIELTRLHHEIRIFADKLAALEDLQQKAQNINH
ncbi:STAS domain-containing protein [Candidatus Albibeggiatoa sp. nov. NOAA]|uniref:STAS domain-containing protein n=1 Tax=Candidatus Albibeggiatoa sp. nov. NOAA TaxID=3162724 RepID=UPI0032F6D064|nr:STAS domain-containing protein [Thiotrichaceae bacterium]